MAKEIVVATLFMAPRSAFEAASILSVAVVCWLPMDPSHLRQQYASETLPT